MNGQIYIPYFNKFHSHRYHKWKYNIPVIALQYGNIIITIDNIHPNNNEPNE
jgi:hypothetical protein